MIWVELLFIFAAVKNEKYGKDKFENRFKLSALCKKS